MSAEEMTFRKMQTFIIALLSTSKCEVAIEFIKTSEFNVKCYNIANIGYIIGAVLVLADIG